MPAPGSRIDRFEILELIGAGGMGEVYRARDLRLGREVALKLLPDQFLQNPQRLGRFERETQVLASLNHPNIAVLHEIVTLGDSHALVMELVEGETLSDLLAARALTWREALGIAAQMATALDAAHEQGIVHRDLKPANIKLRPDGTVKLLDFGLAKVTEAQTSAVDAAAVTLTAAGPPAGGANILGSPAYMSPEQARGLPVDKRADIWSFGCVLYEMLSGVRAFSGEWPSDVMAKIIERDPDFTALPAELPPTILRLLQRCLEKDRRQRLRDIGDARHELLEALDHSGSGPMAGAALAARAAIPRSRALRRSVISVALVAALIAALAAATAWFTRRHEPAALPVTRFVIDERSDAMGGLAISRDGTRIAYVTSRGLVVRSRDRLDSTLVATRNLVQGDPFFSPDGEWVGFKGWAALRKVSASGGPVATVLDERVASIGTWQGQDIFFADMTGVFRISAAGGKPLALVTAVKGEQINFVEALPERNAILFTVVPAHDNNSDRAANLPSARIEALDLATGRRHTVLQGGGQPRYTRTGHLLYVSSGTLYAIGFDMERLQTRGTAVPVIQGNGLMDYDVSKDGTLIYRSSAAESRREMVWVDRQGQVTSLGAPLMNYVYPRLSPDGNRVAVDVAGSTARDVWTWDIPRHTLERFTKDPAGHPLLAWSRDGRYLAYGNEVSGVSNVYRQAADGSGTPEHLLESKAVQMPMSFTPDGRLLVSVVVPHQQRDIHVMTLDGTRGTRPLVHGPANELWGEVSPDGRWVAYDSDESGQFEVYVRPYPDAYAGGRWQVSAAGGRQPLWSRNGRELFYRDFSGALMSIPIGAGPTFTPGRPVRILEGGRYIGGGASGSGRTYDVAPDGSRFLMIRDDNQQTGPLVVVLNWFEELKRLAPIPAG